MKKEKNIKMIDIIYWSIIMMCTFMQLFLELQEEIQNGVVIALDFKMMLNIICFIIISSILNIIRIFPISIIYWGVRSSIKKHNKERLEKVDFENTDYYREILPKYSPAELSYIDDFNIDKEDIVATLLALELKGKINIKDDGIKVVNCKIEDLEKNEKYILNKVKEKGLKGINILEYTKIVEKDAVDKGLLQEKHDVKKRLIKKIIANIIKFIFIILCSQALNAFILGKSINNINMLYFILLMISWMLIVLIPGATITHIYHYIMLNKAQPYIRNNEGKMINLRLEGLRKYLLEFSMIKEKTKKHLRIWEEYLIYSVILGINTKLIDEVYNKIKKGEKNE